MYEYHLPLVMLANRKLQLGPGSGTDPAQIVKDLKLGLKYLRAGLKILAAEPEGSFEAKIVTGSQHSVAELEEWIKTVSTAILQ